MTVTKIEYRGSGFYGNRPTKIIKGEWQPREFSGGVGDGFMPPGFHPIRQDEIGPRIPRPKGADR